LVVDAARHHHLGFERRAHCREPTVARHVVGIAERHRWRPGRRNPDIESEWLAALWGGIHRPHGQPGVGGRKALEHCPRGIGRAVVGEHDLPRPIPTLGSQPLQGFPERRRAVTAGDDHADRRNLDLLVNRTSDATLD